MARPKQFQPEYALGKAMEAFWGRGYEATSVQDLVNATGVSRQSLYDTFGGKRDLFLACIDHYIRTINGRIPQILGAPGSPLANVRRAMTEMANVFAAQNGRGCLVSNTVVEMGDHDSAIAEKVRSNLRFVRAIIHGALDRSVEAEELPRSTDTAALSRFLLCTLQGLVVMARAGAEPGEVQEVTGVALSVLG
ncbi:MAG: TetR/AcrR family transcriptional regulator [Phycisphaerae bacterium]